MDDCRHPHHFHADLTPERLAVIDGVIRKCRALAFTLLAAVGHAKWSAGCLAYELTMYELERLSGELDWLGFWREQQLAYGIRIGSVPIRVQRSDHAPKAVMVTENALANATQIPLPFGDGRKKLSDYMVRLVFSVDGPKVGLCELTVRNASDRVLYETWLIDTEATLAEAVNASATTSKVEPLVRQDAQVLDMADFGLPGEDKEEREDGSDLV